MNLTSAEIAESVEKVKNRTVNNVTNGSWEISINTSVRINNCSFNPYKKVSQVLGNWSLLARGDNAGPDRPARSRRLIWTFAVQIQNH